MDPKAVLVHTERYHQFDFGRDHPLRMYRLKFTTDLMRWLGWYPSDVVEPEPAGEELIFSFHSPEYVKALATAEKGGRSFPEMGIGTPDCPVFEGCYALPCLNVDGTTKAVELALEGRWAFHMGGGMHHAHADRASGFCYLNDPVIGIKRAMAKGAKVLYLDIDAHHGDGVQEAFYETDQVLTFSIHQYSPGFFPGTGGLDEMGEGRGRGYSLNLPLPPHTEDETYWWAYGELFPLVLERFKPDLLFVQFGVDGHRDDPLASLYLSTYLYEKIIRDITDRWQGPLVLVGGGGYDMVNVARIWTIVWGVLNGFELPELLPEPFLRISTMSGYDGPHLHDIPGWSGETVDENVKRLVAELQASHPLLTG
jgi:acetoin utilization protein AcuC